jgi:hypothetical protein
METKGNYMLKVKNLGLAFSFVSLMFQATIIYAKELDGPSSKALDSEDINNAITSTACALIIAQGVSSQFEDYYIVSTDDNGPTQYSADNQAVAITKAVCEKFKESGSIPDKAQVKGPQTGKYEASVKQGLRAGIMAGTLEFQLEASCNKNVDSNNNWSIVRTDECIKTIKSQYEFVSGVAELQEHRETLDKFVSDYSLLLHIQ